MQHSSKNLLPKKHIVSIGTGELVVLVMSIVTINSIEMESPEIDEALWDLTDHSLT